MGFEDIIGHERVKKILKKSLQKKKIPNSMLFCGPEGVGKRGMAFALAKAINCEQKKDDACETCSLCKAIDAGNHPDVMEIQPDGEVIKIEQMRTLRQIAYLKPMVGKKRIFIVDEAEKMTEEAANSLLTASFFLYHTRDSKSLPHHFNHKIPLPDIEFSAGIEAGH